MPVMFGEDSNDVETLRRLMEEWYLPCDIIDDVLVHTTVEKIPGGPSLYIKKANVGAPTILVFGGGVETAGMAIRSTVNQLGKDQCNYNIIAGNLRGFGGHGFRFPLWSMTEETVVKDIKEILKYVNNPENGFGEKVFVKGFSFGGALASKALKISEDILDCNKKIKGLMLVSPINGVGGTVRGMVGKDSVFGRFLGGLTSLIYPEDLDTKRCLDSVDPKIKKNVALGLVSGDRSADFLSLENGDIPEVVKDFKSGSSFCEVLPNHVHNEPIDLKRCLDKLSEQ